MGWALVASVPLSADDKPATENKPPVVDAGKKGPEAKGPEQLFRELDKNNDGKITTEEVGAEHRRHFDHLLREAGKTDKDGLTRDEFLKALQPDERRIKGVNDFGGREGRRGKGNFEPGQFFNLLDKNKDGKLTLEEVPDRMRERFPQALRQAGKKDGDSLTREEFQKFVGRGPREGMGGRDAGLQIGNPEEFLKRHDKNSDGKVSLEEVDGRMRGGFERILERLKKDPDAGLNLDDLRKLQGAEMARGQGDRSREEDRPMRDGEAKRREGDRPEGEPGRRPGFPPQSPLLKLLDANHDGKITKDEIARITEVFDKLDANHDGALDPFELMGPPPERRRNERGEGMDRGEPGDRKGPPRDGDVRRPGEANSEGPPRGEGKDDLKGGGRRRFERLDVDQDKKISRSEARGPLLKNFEKFDSNKDGFLDQDEIRKGRLELGLGEGRRRPPEEDKKPVEAEKKPVPASESK